MKAKVDELHGRIRFRSILLEAVRPVAPDVRDRKLVQVEVGRERRRGRRVRGVGEERGDNDGVDEWDSFRCRDRYTSRATRRELSVVVESVVVAGRSTLPPGVSSCGAKVNVGSKEGEGSEGRGREGEGRGAAASGVDMN